MFESWCHDIYIYGLLLRQGADSAKKGTIQQKAVTAQQDNRRNDNSQDDDSQKAVKFYIFFHDGIFKELEPADRISRRQAKNGLLMRVKFHAFALSEGPTAGAHNGAI